MKDYKLYYREPDGQSLKSLDLETVEKIERCGKRLLLFVDEKRKHQLREVSASRRDSSRGPSLDAWEAAIVDRVESARLRRFRARRGSGSASPTTSPRDKGSSREDDDELVGEPQQKSTPTRRHAPAVDEKAHYRQLIVDFYRRTNPDKVPKVDALIAKYAEIGVKEPDLLLAIQNKYDKIRMLR